MSPLETTSLISQNWAHFFRKKGKRKFHQNYNIKEDGEKNTNTYPKIHHHFIFGYVFLGMYLCFSLHPQGYMDVEGYINFISSPRKSKADTEFYELDVNCRSKSIRGVCYEADRIPLLKKFTNKSCLFINAEVSNDDFIVSDKTIVKEKDVDFCIWFRQI